MLRLAALFYHIYTMHRHRYRYLIDTMNNESDMSSLLALTALVWSLTLGDFLEVNILPSRVLFSYP